DRPRALAASVGRRFDRPVHDDSAARDRARPEAPRALLGRAGGRCLAAEQSLMRVAALYDIHGNLPALDAVLAEVDTEGFDAIVVGGDACWGPWPAETLERLRWLGDRGRFVRGNTDREQFETGGKRAATDEWVGARLDADAEAFVATWPLTLE